MALQVSTAIQNARLDTMESTPGATAVLKIFSGAVPANCGTADSGTVLVTMTLPTDWMAAASGGTKAKLGTWEDTSADATGTAGHFRIYESTGTTCHMQGNVTITAGGGVMEIDSLSITIAQTVTVTTFTLTDGNS